MTFPSKLIAIHCTLWVQWMCHGKHNKLRKWMQASQIEWTQCRCVTTISRELVSFLIWTIINKIHFTCLTLICLKLSFLARHQTKSSEKQPEKQMAAFKHEMQKSQLLVLSAMWKNVKTHLQKHWQICKIWQKHSTLFYHFLKKFWQRNWMWL